MKVTVQEKKAINEWNLNLYTDLHCNYEDGKEDYLYAYENNARGREQRNQASCLLPKPTVHEAM